MFEIKNLFNNIKNIDSYSVDNIDNRIRPQTPSQSKLCKNLIVYALTQNRPK